MPHRFQVVQGTPPPDTPKQRAVDRLKAASKPGILECPRCACRELIETRTGVTSNSRGTLALICAACLLKGERIVVA